MIKSDYSYLTPLFIKRSELTISSRYFDIIRTMKNYFNQKLCKYMVSDYIQFISKTTVYLKNYDKI